MALDPPPELAAVNFAAFIGNVSHHFIQLRIHIVMH